jgi:hypothetical protein
MSGEASPGASVVLRSIAVHVLDKHLVLSNAGPAMQ